MMWGYRAQRTLGQQLVSSRCARVGDSEDPAPLKREHHDDVLHQEHVECANDGNDVLQGLQGMEKLEHDIAERLEGQNFRDSDRTPKQDSGATPESVN